MIRNSHVSQYDLVVDEDTMVVKIADFSMSLRWLKIDGRYFSDMGMIKIGEGCPKIQHLSISHCSNITDISIVKIAECCQKFLDVSESGRNLIDRGMTEIAEYSPNIENLNISFCCEIIDVSLTKIEESCQNLKV
jgi:hypothetical protein